MVKSSITVVLYRRYFGGYSGDGGKEKNSQIRSDAKFAEILG